jgi:ribonuclease J
MHRIYKAARQCGYLQNLIEPVDPRDARNISREKIIYLSTGSQGEPMGATKRIVNGIHPDVYLEKGDTIIFSSKIIPGNEKKLYAMHNEIVRNEIQIITEENSFVHVSGHPNRDDLKDMYSWVKPKSVIPVHGEHRHMQEQAKFAKEMKVPHTLQVENGDIIKISPSNDPQIIDKAPSGRMYLDGFIGVREDSSSIKERRNIAVNGYLEVTILVTNNGKIKKPIVSFKGIPTEEISDSLVFDVEDEVANICRKFSVESKKQEQNLIDTVKQSCRKIIRDKTGKKPYATINISRI